MESDDVAKSSPSPTTVVTASSATDRGLSHIHWKSWLTYVGAAAAVRTTMLHPLTVAMARKRVVTDDTHSKAASLRHLMFTVPANGSNSNFSSTTTTSRLRFAYRGFGVAVFANVVGETLYFGVLEYIRHVLDKSAVDRFRDSVGGLGAEFVSLTLCTPLSVVCHRQMTAGFGVAAATPYGSAATTYHDVVRGGDYKKLFSGLSVALTALPAAAIWWGLYSQSKSFLYGHLRRNDADGSTNNGINDKNSGPVVGMTLDSTRDNPVINGLSGFGASVATTILFNPFNVVRTRVQAAGGGSVMLVARAMLRNEGARAFMKGATISSCSAALEGAIVSSIYEYTKWLSDITM